MSSIKNLLLCAFFTFILNSTCLALVGGDTSGKSDLTAKLARFSISFKGCTLTRISDRFFLAAAHCSRAPDGLSGEFRFFYDANGEKQDVLSYFRTHSYVDWLSYIADSHQLQRPLDIMVYEFSLDDLNKFQEISVARFDFGYIPVVGSQIILTGYGGYTEKTVGESSSGEKLYAPVVDNQFRSKLQRIASVDSSYIFVSQFDDHGDEVRLAMGDSGGALFNEQFQIIGVNSYVDRKSFAQLSSGIARIDRSTASPLNSVQISEWLNKFTKSN